MRTALHAICIACVTLAAAACGSSGAQPATGPAVPVEQAPPAGICGAATSPPGTFDHVIVLLLENHSYDQLIGGAAAGQAPYLNALATHCGIATGYRAITHPSLPNYLAATGGSTFGITSDCQCQVGDPSIFSELAANGGSWAAYAESMPSPCQSTDALQVSYTAHHNPPVFYRQVESTCAAHDLPLGTPLKGPMATALRKGTLARYVFIAPNRCHDMHDCSIRTGDAWVSWWVNAIVRSPVYQHQSTAIFITVDEGSGGHIGKGEDCAAHLDDESCHVPLIVVSRYVPAGRRVRMPLDHYSLMRGTAELTGVAPLANAQTAPDFLHAFGLR
ncbi:MAG: alkaline phosphatase family protein [Gaiellales bacterium]